MDNRVVVSAEGGEQPTLFVFSKLPNTWGGNTNSELAQIEGGKGNTPETSPPEQPADELRDFGVDCAGADAALGSLFGLVSGEVVIGDPREQSVRTKAQGQVPQLAEDRLVVLLVLGLLFPEAAGGLAQGHLWLPASRLYPHLELGPHLGFELVRRGFCGASSRAMKSNPEVIEAVAVGPPVLVL